MKPATRNRSLRLKRMAAESVLREKILTRERLGRTDVAIVARRIKGIVEEMQAEWEANPTSGELGDAFHLLTEYLECLIDRV